MKKAVLLLNGAPYNGDIDCEGCAVYCCDGAYSWAKGRVRIDKNIGDFDSLDEAPYPAPEEIYPSEKNFTDGEIAIQKILADGADDITIYGAFGGREDHFLGNLHLLLRASRGGAAVRMISEDTLIFPAGGRTELGEYVGKTVSVFPFSAAAHIIGSAGLKYAYPQRLCYGECRGVSNIVESGDAYLEVAEGDAVLIIINRGNV